MASTGSALRKDKEPGDSEREDRDAAPAAAGRRRRPLRTLLRLLLVLGLALVIGGSTFVGGLLAAPADFSLPPAPKPVLLFAADGTTQIGSIAPVERREPVRAQDIPQVMRDAIMAAEDERFLEHKGVDPISTARAAFRDLTGSKTQGGSTLTQQYVKNAYVGNDRTALRKVREAALAVRLEQQLSKQEILTNYLNALYLGNGLYGVQAGAKYYFGVPVKDLDLNEKTGKRDRILGIARAALLAGIAPAPSAWNPVKDFSTARDRQQYTLNRMVVGRSISPQDASEAYDRPVKPLREAPPTPKASAPEFADLVTAQLKTDYPDEDELFRGGLRVRTTLDSDLQRAVTKAVATVLPNESDPQAAVVAIDIKTGDIRAMTTARRVPKKVDRKGKTVRKESSGYQRGAFNLATNAQRSSGSTIKPFTLAVALEQGQSLGTTRYAPNKDSIPNPGGIPDPYVYGNSDVSESGTFTLSKALADSINTVYLPLADEVGRGKVKALAERAGLKGSITSTNLSFGIGAGVDVTPASVATAYATLADHGVRHDGRLVTEIRSGGTDAADGPVIARNKVPEGVRALPVGVADKVVEAMTEVVTNGTGTGARQSFPVFGKTGTTNNSTDAWFVGCAPSQGICIATWMGYEDITCSAGDGTRIPSGDCGGMRYLHGVPQVYGGTLPAEIFDETFDQLRTIKGTGGSSRTTSTGSTGTRTSSPSGTSGTSGTGTSGTGTSGTGTRSATPSSTSGAN